MKIGYFFKGIAVASALVLSACGPAEEDRGSREDVVEKSDAERLEELQDGQGKADFPAPCGQETCEYDMCGYDCTTAGSQCVRSCADVDAREESYVLFNASGAENVRLDSRDLAYVPRFSLDRVLLYGCDVFDYSNGESDDLEIKYKKIYKGAFAVGQPQNIGEDAYVYIRDFQGPGSYMASARYSPNSQASDSDRYWGKDVCGVEVDALSNGGIRGEFVCDAVPSKGGGASVRLVGEFECGVNAMDLQFVDLGE